MWLYAFIALLFIAAIGVQVYYAKVYWAQAPTAAKVVWCANIGLLSALLAGVSWIAYTQAGG